MLDRIYTTLFLVTGSFLLFLFYNPFLLATAFTLISLVAYYEWLSVSKVKSKIKYICILSMTAIMYLLVTNTTYNLVQGVNLVSLIIWMLITIDLFNNFNLTKKILSKFSIIFGFIIILATWYLLISFNEVSNTAVIQHSEFLLFNSDFDSNNIHYYIFIILLVSLVDIFALLIGKYFGINALCPDISPKKTTEGLIGGIAATLAVIYVINIYYFNIDFLFIDIIFFIICCLYCTIGDLFISIFKRFNNVKDTGNILPGHGGVLDRIDSYLPVIAIMQFWLIL